MGFRERQCTVAVAAVLLTGAWVSSASASTVAVDGDAVVYKAGDGEANDLTVRDDVGGSTFTDAGATIEPGAGCAALPSGAVACAPGPALLTVAVGDRADSVDADTNFFVEIRVTGGIGDDTLHSGSASGRLHEVDGGSGDDTIATAVNLIGTQVDDGGPGDDSVWAQGGGFGNLTGGSGDDSLRYTQRSPGQTPELMDGGSGTDLYWWEGPDPFDDQFPARALAAGDGFDTLKIDLGPFGPAPSSTSRPATTASPASSARTSTTCCWVTAARTSSRAAAATTRSIRAAASTSSTAARATTRSPCATACRTSPPAAMGPTACAPTRARSTMSARAARRWCGRHADPWRAGSGRARRGR
jgi:hypothetical protein